MTSVSEFPSLPRSNLAAPTTYTEGLEDEGPNIFDEGRKAFARISVPPLQPRRGPSLDDESGLNAIADSEGWRVPPREVTRVALRPWRQALFWGVRIYIVVMLAIMVVGFFRVAIG